MRARARVCNPPHRHVFALEDLKIIVMHVINDVRFRSLVPTNPSAWFCALSFPEVMDMVMQLVRGDVSAQTFKISSREAVKCTDVYGQQVPCIKGSSIDFKDFDYSEDNTLRFDKGRVGGEETTLETFIPVLPIQTILSDRRSGTVLYRLGEYGLGVCVTRVRAPASTKHFALPEFFASESGTGEERQPNATRGWTSVLLTRDFTGRFRIFRDEALMLDATPLLDHRIEPWSSRRNQEFFGGDEDGGGNVYRPSKQQLKTLLSPQHADEWRNPVVLGALMVVDVSNQVLMPALFLHGRIQFLSIYTGIQTPGSVLTSARSDSVCESCPFELHAMSVLPGAAAHVGGGGCSSDPAAGGAASAAAGSAVLRRSVSTAAELLWAVSNAPTDETGVIITVTADLVVEETIVIRSRTNVSLHGVANGEGGAPTVIVRGGHSSGRHLRINEGGLLHELSEQVALLLLRSSLSLSHPAQNSAFIRDGWL